jgi:hypothetical protein
VEKNRQTIWSTYVIKKLPKMSNRPKGKKILKSGHPGHETIYLLSLPGNFAVSR